MKTELEKMIAGEMYDPSDRELAHGRNRARKFCREINDAMDSESRASVLKRLFGGTKKMFMWNLISVSITVLIFM